MLGSVIVRNEMAHLDGILIMQHQFRDLTATIADKLDTMMNSSQPQANVFFQPEN